MSGANRAGAAQPGLPNLLWLLVSLLVVGLDQWAKGLVVEKLPLYTPYPLFAHLNFTHARNTGAAFSMMNHLPPQAFAALGVAVAAALGVWLWRNPYRQRLVAAAFALVLGGALGNVIDRAHYGYVVDFVDFYIGRWHFATFNVADIAITCGAALLILDVLRGSPGARKTEAHPG